MSLKWATSRILSDVIGLCRKVSVQMAGLLQRPIYGKCSFLATPHAGLCIGAVPRRWANPVSMSGQRRRRWSNDKTTLVQRFVFAVIAIKSTVALNSHLLLMKLLGNNSTVNSSLTVFRPRTVILKAINPRHVIGPRWPPRPITRLISRSTVLRIFDQGPLYPSAFSVLCFISPNAVIRGFQPMLF